MFKAEVPTVIEDGVSLSANINPAAEEECNAIAQNEKPPFRHKNEPRKFGLIHSDPDNVTTAYKKKEGTCPHFDKASSTRVVKNGVWAVNDHFNCWLLDALKDKSSSRERIEALLEGAPEDCKLRAAVRVKERIIGSFS